MAYAVKELFLTIQGEGAQAGRVAVFCRFTGCNLWTGREEDRAVGRGGCSQWCDTDFVGTNGDGGGKFSDADALADAAWKLWENLSGVPLLVCTGGEPLLQLDIPLIAAFKKRGFSIAIETNGTLPLPDGIDWVCVSPKANAPIVVQTGQELKLVVPQEGIDPAAFVAMDFEHHFVQPMDGPDKEASLQFAIAYCLDHPNWRLSLQTHKFIGVP